MPNERIMDEETVELAFLQKDAMTENLVTRVRSFMVVSNVAATPTDRHRIGSLLDFYLQTF